jgi:hypothetical protein
MQKVVPLSFFLFLSLSVCSQVPTDSTALITFNQQLDDNVVSGNIAFLQKGYASDFVFSHGSGRVDGKVSWLGSVAKGGFIKQRHDSVTVEMHGDIAILRSRVVCREKYQINNRSVLVALHPGILQANTKVAIDLAYHHRGISSPWLTFADPAIIT